MKHFLSKICRAVLLLLVAAPKISAAEPSPVPKEFSAFIGGFNGPSYRLELHDGSLTYTTLRGGQTITKHTIAPSAAQWREFCQALDGFKVWQWRAEYANGQIRDGTQWSLDIAYADHAIKSHGSNSYPDANGRPSGKPDFTTAFQGYLDAIEKLIGGKTFR